MKEVIIAVILMFVLPEMAQGHVTECKAINDGYSGVTLTSQNGGVLLEHHAKGIYNKAILTPSKSPYVFKGHTEWATITLVADVKNGVASFEDSIYSVNSSYGMLTFLLKDCEDL